MKHLGLTDKASKSLITKYVVISERPHPSYVYTFDQLLNLTFFSDFLRSVCCLL